nr:immunoglobulin heavy chain junction region [Mus musculus]
CARRTYYGYDGPPLFDYW